MPSRMMERPNDFRNFLCALGIIQDAAK
jgi:hypothetical protein